MTVNGNVTSSATRQSARKVEGYNVALMTVQRYNVALMTGQPTAFCHSSRDATNGCCLNYVSLYSSQISWSFCYHEQDAFKYWLALKCPLRKGSVMGFVFFLKWTDLLVDKTVSFKHMKNLGTKAEVGTGAGQTTVYCITCPTLYRL